MSEPQTQEQDNPLRKRLIELEAAQAADRQRVAALQDTIKQATTEIQTRSGHILTRAGRIDELTRILDG